jgi:hypothetical protein
MAESDPLGQTKYPFCKIDASLVVAANELALAIRDTNPVTPLHTLILPRQLRPLTSTLRPRKRRLWMSFCGHRRAGRGIRRR